MWLAAEVGRVACLSACELQEGSSVTKTCQNPCGLGSHLPLEPGSFLSLEKQSL